MTPVGGVGFPQDSVVRGEMAASGGYGDPLERDPAAVYQDVRQEKIPVQHALKAYGVVIRGEKLELNREATATERTRQRNSASNNDAT